MVRLRASRLRRDKQDLQEEMGAGVETLRHVCRFFDRIGA